MTRNPSSQVAITLDSRAAAEDTPETYTVHTSQIFEPLSKSFAPNVSITVSRRTGLITHVERRSSAALPTTTPLSEHDLDLRHLPLVLPGLTDAHTHIFLHAYADSPSRTQELSESPVERILRASNHCRAALNAGFTTYRDLGTEGLADADAHVRNAVNRGIIPGPRLFVATEPIASSGGYAVRTESDATASLGHPYGAGAGPFSLGLVTNPRLADPADGVVGVRAAVRRRLAAGADIIKVYADYRKRALRWPAALPEAKGADREIHFPPSNLALRNPNTLLWTQEELNAIVSEARAAGAPVAMHAQSARAVWMAAQAGASTIEHAFEDEIDELQYHPFATPLESDAALRAMHEAGTVFVPTLSVLEEGLPPALFAKAVLRVRRAAKIGVRIGVGGDTGATAHGTNAREIELLVDKVGLDIKDVLRAATVGGWEVCFGREVDGEGKLGGILGGKEGHTAGNAWEAQASRMFGAIRKGWVADLVGLAEGVDLEGTRGGKSLVEGGLRDVDFVMKDGEVVKWYGAK